MPGQDATWICIGKRRNLCTAQTHPQNHIARGLPCDFKPERPLAKHTGVGCQRTQFETVIRVRCHCRDVLGPGGGANQYRRYNGQVIISRALPVADVTLQPPGKTCDDRFDSRRNLCSIHFLHGRRDCLCSRRLFLIAHVMASRVPPNQAPAFVAPIPTPTLGDGGSASIVFSTTIAASPAKCLEILLDPETYPTWNKWIPRVVVTSASPASESSIPPSLAHIAAKEVRLLPNAKFYFEVHMNPESASFRKTELELSVLEEFEHEGKRGFRVAWKSQGSPWFLRAERVQEFVDNGTGGCEYTNYETFFGPLTWAVKSFAGKQLEKGLMLWMNGLKAEAEAGSGPEN